MDCKKQIFAISEARATRYLLDMLGFDEGGIFETTAEERKAIEDSHRAFIREAEKGI